MATEEEKQEVRRQIEAFFRFAGVPVPWNGVVNEDVAAVFGVMLRETAQCSKAMAWVPRPPTGPATIGYLAKQLRGALSRQMEHQLSTTCAKDVIRTYRTDFDLATMAACGALRFTRWA